MYVCTSMYVNPPLRHQRFPTTLPTHRCMDVCNSRVTLSNRHQYTTTLVAIDLYGSFGTLPAVPVLLFFLESAPIDLIPMTTLSMFDLPKKAPQNKAKERLEASLRKRHAEQTDKKTGGGREA